MQRLARETLESMLLDCTNLYSKFLDSDPQHRMCVDRYKGTPSQKTQEQCDAKALGILCQKFKSLKMWPIPDNVTQITNPSMFLRAVKALDSIDIATSQPSLLHTACDPVRKLKELVNKRHEMIPAKAPQELHDHIEKQVHKRLV